MCTSLPSWSMTWVLVTAGRLGVAGLAIVLILTPIGAWGVRSKPTKPVVAPTITPAPAA